MSRVGQFLGKLFAGQGDKAAVLRAYGKLPIYAEYRRLELAPGTPTAFSQWLDAGRLAWARSASKSDSGAVKTSRLFIQLPETREAIVASIWDSRDSLGRTFPFAFFVVCSPQMLGKDLLEHWVAAYSIHEAFDGFHRELAKLGRGGDFYRHYQKRAVALQPEELTQRAKRLHYDASTIDAQAWFESALSGVDAEAWFAGLLRRVERWKSEPRAVAQLALRIPLAHKLPNNVQSLLWLRWISNAVAKGGRTPWFVVPADDHGRTVMHILVRDLLPDDFQVLTTDAGAYGYVEDLGQIPQGDASAPDPAEATTPTGSLLEWLSKHTP